MCGIAGFSVKEGVDLNGQLFARALLSAIADRGADAVGVAAHRRSGGTLIAKRRGPASEYLPHLELPADADTVLLHTRAWTQGSPEKLQNNHPLVCGAVVGVHNGIVENDRELTYRYNLRRTAAVDSEAIFALLDRFGSSEESTRVLEQLQGPCAAAWFDDREPGELFLARGLARPLAIGIGRGVFAFASTLDALAEAAERAGVTLQIYELTEGRFCIAQAGELSSHFPFHPAPSRLGTRVSAPAPEERRRSRLVLSTVSA